MPSREISIWIDEHWYDALTKHLKGETVEEHLEDVVDQMCNQLPEHEYMRVSTLIWQEQQDRMKEHEAARRFAVFHVTENGSSTYFLAEENLEMLQVALRLRNYIRSPSENAPAQFIGMFRRGERITPEQFDQFVSERLDNTGRVTGAFKINLDNGRFDALHILDGWQCFNTQDVTTAAYFAMKKHYAAAEDRWAVFLERLDGKQLTPDSQVSAVKYIEGSRRLQPNEISVEGEVMWSHETLEFYVPIHFDPSKVFGSEVANVPADTYVNVYAYYDLEKQAVRDDLTVLLCHSKEPDEEFRYKLTPEEKELFRERMNELCTKYGEDLEECRKEYLQEETAAQGPTMQM